MKTYLLTVVVPVYNVEQTVARTIKSIIQQPLFEDIELIIVNDGSTDKSLAICTDLAKGKDNIKIITKRNGGLSSARNEGIKVARGKYVGFLDADDWWEKNFFDYELVCQLDNGNIDVYGFSYNNVSTLLKYCKPLRVKSGENYFEINQKNRYNYYHLCSHLFRIDFLKNNNLFFCHVK